MKIREARKNIGKLVMTCDPGPKMIKSMRPHGPYKLTKITKAGLAMLENYEYRVPPSSLSKPNVSVFFEDDGAPRLYTNCGSDKITETIISVIDVYNGMGPTAELDCNCQKCGLLLGGWAYGSWDSGFKHGYEELCGI